LGDECGSQAVADAIVEVIDHTVRSRPFRVHSNHPTMGCHRQRCRRSRPPELLQLIGLQDILKPTSSAE